VDIEEFLKQKPGINSFLSKLRAKPPRLEFSRMLWAPLDVISVLAREGEYLQLNLMIICKALMRNKAKAQAECVDLVSL
jgi:hypothetical protein